MAHRQEEVDALERLERAAEDDGPQNGPHGPPGRDHGRGDQVREAEVEVRPHLGERNRGAAARREPDPDAQHNCREEEHERQ